MSTVQSYEVGADWRRQPQLLRVYAASAYAAYRSRGFRLRVSQDQGSVVYYRGGGGRKNKTVSVFVLGRFGLGGDVRVIK